MVDSPDPPGARLTSPGALLIANFAALTVRLMVVDEVRLPEVPVMVTMAFPEVAVSLVTSVNVLFPVEGLGEKDAVTPLGSPDRAKFTLPVNPHCGYTLMVAEAVPPSFMLRL